VNPEFKPQYHKKKKKKKRSDGVAQTVKHLPGMFEVLGYTTHTYTHTHTQGLKQFTEILKLCRYITDTSYLLYIFLYY
jgi:hypothetical protein